MQKNIAIVIFAVIVILGGYTAYRLLDSPNEISEKNNSGGDEVEWFLDQGNSWSVKGEPPTCPDPLVFKTPVNTAQVTSIGYPGQIRSYQRSYGFKSSGSFRFDTSDGRADVYVPFDAKLTRVAPAFRLGEYQYGFEFVAPCGIWYSFGHLRELTPKFKDIADSFPVITDNPDGSPPKVQFYDVNPSVPVTAGEKIATAVGYAQQNNFFIDFTVLDLRHTNGKKIRDEWKQYADSFDRYGICWLENISEVDREYFRKLHNGNVESGTKSDYCNYPENK